jgi:hypothetical protein
MANSDLKELSEALGEGGILEYGFIVSKVLTSMVKWRCFPSIGQTQFSDCPPRYWLIWVEMMFEHGRE